jgi:hypothetical protein
MQVGKYVPVVLKSETNHDSGNYMFSVVGAEGVYVRMSADQVKAAELAFEKGPDIIETDSVVEPEAMVDPFVDAEPEPEQVQAP